MLLIVDVIWVASSELTEYIFNDKHYDKPFFSTYLKVCLAHTGFAKTFGPSLVILSDETGVLRQTFWGFVSHLTLKMAGKYDSFAGHFVWRSRSSSSDIFKIRQTCLT